MLKSLDSRVGRSTRWLGWFGMHKAGGFLCQIPWRRASLYSSIRLPVCPPARLINIIRSFSQSNHRILYLLFISVADLPSSFTCISPLPSLFSPHRVAHYRQAGRRAGLITNSNVAGRAKQRRVAFCSLRWPDRRDGPDRPRPTAAAAVHPSMNRSLKRREGREKGRRGGRRGEGAAAPTC